MPSAMEYKYEEVVEKYLKKNGPTNRKRLAVALGLTESSISAYVSRHNARPEATTSIEMVRIKRARRKVYVLKPKAAAAQKAKVIQAPKSGATITVSGVNFNDAIMLIDKIECVISDLKDICKMASPTTKTEV